MNPSESNPQIIRPEQVPAVPTPEQVVAPVPTGEQAPAPMAPPAPVAPSAPVPAPPVPPAWVAVPSEPVAAPAAAGLPTPATAADEDVIEKEWVDKTEDVINRTAADPYAEEEAIEALQIEYLKKRYGHEVKKPTE